MDDPSYTVTPIPLSRLVDEGFSEKDRLGMAKYIDPDIHYAWLYRDDEKRWKHVDRELVDIDTIVEYSDSDYTSTSKYSYTNLQTHRVGPNPKTASIRGDIETNGWAIDVLPPAVEQVVDGEGNKLNFRLDGATRITLAKSAGVPNMLVDKFIVEKPKDKVRLGLIYNTYQKPFGEGSIKDVTNGVQKMVNQGMIDFSCREMGYDNFSLDTISATDGKKFDWVSNVIKKEMNMVSSNKIRGADLNNAVIEIVNEANIST